jgi:hypothetical protein
MRTACNAGDTRVVQALLSDPRVDPSENENEALRCAVEGGFTDIVRLLVANPKVQEMEHNIWSRYFIDRAISASHVETVTFMLTVVEVEHVMLIIAIRSSSLEMISLLMRQDGLDPSRDNNHALREARRRRRVDVEELLLSDVRVRELDETSTKR